MLFVQDTARTRLALLLADTPYDVVAIQRGRDVELQPGVTIRVCSPEDWVIYKLILTHLRDHEDAQGLFAGKVQTWTMSMRSTVDWLHQFEQALDDSTLVAEYKSLRKL